MKIAPTIREIADKLGLHNSTVSLALRNDPRIRAETRERVRAMADKMGYTPNPAITSLMSRIRAGRKNAGLRETIAYVTSPGVPNGWRHNHAYYEVYKGAQLRAQELGFHLDLFEDRSLLGPRLGQILNARGIRGAIAATLHDIPPALSMEWKGIAVIHINSNQQISNIQGVCNDQEHATVTAFNNLYSYGYRRIGIAINEPWDKKNGDYYHSGYLKSLRNHPDAANLTPFISPDWTQAAFAKWLTAQKPDVIMTLDRNFVWQWLRAMSLQVPKDIAYAELSIPYNETEISGIYQQHELVGRTAVSYLLHHICNHDYGVINNQIITRIGGVWFEGKTTPRRLPA